MTVSKTFANAAKFGMDPDDFAQELRLWCWQNETKVENWFDDPAKGRRYLTTALRNRCKDIYARVKAERLGNQDPADAYYYSIKELELLLPAMFDRAEWSSPPQPERDGTGAEHRRATVDPARGGEWIATLADVSRAFSRLPDNHALIIREFYDYQLSNGEVAHRHGWTPVKTSNIRRGALHALRKILGSRPRPPEPNPWVGRHAMSNARARYETGSQWDGDDIKTWVGQ